MQIFNYGDSKWDLLKKILQNQLDFWTGASAISANIINLLSPSTTFDTVPDITVLTAGTAVQGLNIQCPRGVMVVARLANTNPVYVGGPDVSNASGGKGGIQLTQAGQASTILTVANVNMIWVNADTAGDRVGIVRL